MGIYCQSRGNVKPGREQLDIGAGPRLLNHVLFPDSKIGWLPFGSVAGRHIIDREKPAAVFASAPPFTALLLGVRLKAHAHVPPAADVSPNERPRKPLADIAYWNDPPRR